jgi:putative phosphoesterase
MRLAFISDIHGNPIALDAVLAHIEELGGADEYWALGDLAAIGYDPVGVLEGLVKLPCLRVLRGNTDRYLLTGERPPPTETDVLQRPELMAQFVEVAHGFAWTAGYLAAAGWIDWVADLPTELRATLPDGTRVLAVHGSPASDDGRGLRETMSDDDLAAAVRGCNADLVLAGHTHGAFQRSVNGVQVVNLGSLSNPQTSDRRASYVMLETSPNSHRVEHRRVDYDYDAVLDGISRSHHPNKRFLAHHFKRRAA